MNIIPGKINELNTYLVYCGFQYCPGVNGAGKLKVIETASGSNMMLDDFKDHLNKQGWANLGTFGNPVFCCPDCYKSITGIDKREFFKT